MATRKGIPNKLYYREWTELEDEHIIENFSSKTAYEMAVKLGRTKSAVDKRSEKLKEEGRITREKEIRGRKRIDPEEVFGKLGYEMEYNEDGSYVFCKDEPHWQTRIGFDTTEESPIIEKKCFEKRKGLQTKNGLSWGYSVSLTYEEAKACADVIKMEKSKPKQSAYVLMMERFMRMV